MKTVILLICGLALMSCHDEAEQVNQKKQYTFNVYAPDKTAFQADISYGVNSIQYVDKNSSWLYASGFQAGSSDKFVIKVDSNLDNVVLEITENGGQTKINQQIKTGQLHEFAF